MLTVLLRKIGGDPLNTLFREGLDIILDWSQADPSLKDDEEFVNLASTLIQNIARNIEHPDTLVLKENMVCFHMQAGKYINYGNFFF